MEGFDLIKVIVATNKQWLIRDNAKMFQRFLDPVFGITGRRMLSYFFDPAGSIAHRNR